MSELQLVSAAEVDTLVSPPDVLVEDEGLDAAPPRRVFEGATIWQTVFSFAAMLGTCLVGRVFYSLRAFTVDPDLWWHIRIGEDILATRHWPTADPYSFTAAGQHWLAYEWLGDVLLAAVARAGGVRGLGALLIILGSLIALALYYFTTLRSGNPKAGFVATAVLLNLAVASFNLRPQMLGYLFLVATLIVLERFRQGYRGTIWLLPPLMVIWVNTHGSWIIGLATIGIYLAGGLRQIRVGNLETRRWSHADFRLLAAILALAALGTLITPYGVGLARYPFEVASSAPASLAHVQEWLPLGFKLPGDKLFLVLLLGFLVVQALAPQRLRLEEVGLFLGAAALTCVHMRFLLIFVPFCAPLLAVVLARWLPRYDRTKEVYLLNGALVIATLLAMLWYFPSQAAYAGVVDRTYPVAAVKYLDSHAVPGPMYNSYEFGGYLIWARGPEHRVFIDGRSELYEHSGLFSDYADLLNLKPGSLAVLQKYNIQSCLLWRDEPLATLLGALPGWQKVYVDERNVVFVRR
jgi:hypothetical protein